jgi:hypothetical protein
MIVPANNLALVAGPSWGTGRIVIPPGRRRIARFDARRPGLGQTQQQVVGAAQAGAGSLIGALVATGAIAGPVGALIGAGVGLAATIINTFFQPNYSKISASNDANSLGAILDDNRNAYVSLPVSQRTTSVQAAALAVFDAAWAKYVAAVTPLLAQAPDSISDRQAGACAYHVAAPFGWTGPNTYVQAGPNIPNLPKTPVPGTYCYNTFSGDRDPIANDPYVTPDPIPTSSSTSTATALEESSGLPAGSVAAASVSSGLNAIPGWAWLAIAGVAVLVVMS